MRNPMEQRNFICDLPSGAAFFRNSIKTSVLSLPWVDSSIPGLLSYLVHSRISKWSFENPSPKRNRKEMEWGEVRNLSVDNTELLIDCPSFRRIKIENMFAFTFRESGRKIPTVALLLLQRLDSTKFLNTTTRTPIPEKEKASPQSSRSNSPPLMGFFKIASTVRISGSEDSSSSSRLLFRHLHEIHPLVRCRHEWLTHLHSELLDLQAMRSAMSVSRLLPLSKIQLGFTHPMGFFRLHFPVQGEIGRIILEKQE